MRGSAPGGTQKFVDGTFVPNIYHFGGLSSVVPTEMIEAIDFYPGNFSAKYGRATGGIVDVRLREMQHDGEYHGLAQVDMIDARVMARGPVPGLRGWDLPDRRRRSYVDAWIGPLLEGGVGVRTAPVYYDWQAFVETKPTPRSTFRIGVFGSDDRLSFVFKDASVQDPGMGSSLSTRTRMLRFQTLYRNTISQALSISASASIGTDGERIALRTDAHLWRLPARVRARQRLPTRLTPGLTVRAGPDILYYHVRADIRTTQPPDPGQPAPGPYSQPASALLRRETQNGSQPAGVRRARVGARRECPAPRWRPRRLLQSHGPPRREPSPQRSLRSAPRVSAHHAQGRASACSTSRHEPVEVVEPYGTPNLLSDRAVHYSAGFEQELSREVEVSVEGFYKRPVGRGGARADRHRLGELRQLGTG